MKTRWKSGTVLMFKTQRCYCCEDMCCNPCDAFTQTIALAIVQGYESDDFYRVRVIPGFRSCIAYEEDLVEVRTDEQTIESGQSRSTAGVEKLEG